MRLDDHTASMQPAKKGISVRRHATAAAFALTLLALTTTAAMGLTVRSAAHAFYQDAAPAPAHQLYSDTAEPKADIQAALVTAKKYHRNVILDFGGNWCGDCQVLDIYLHNAVNRPLLEANFVLVDVNVGHLDENLDLARKYDIPLVKGVPALAVLTDKGKLLYSQTNEEFEKMQRVQSSDVTRFLVRWKPVKPGCSVVMMNCQ